MRTGRGRTERAFLVATGVVALLSPALAATDVHPPGRLLLALLFVVLVPGAPLAVLLRLGDGLLTLALGLAISLASLLLVSTALLVSHSWDPGLVAWLLGAVAICVLRPAWRATPQQEPTAPRQVALRRRRPASTPARRAARFGIEVPELYTGLPGAVARAAPLVLPLLVLAAAVELWGYAVLTLDLDRIGAAGLISVVSWSYALSVVLIAGVAGWELRSKDPQPLVMTAVVLSLVLVLFGWLNAADSAPSFRTAWTHVGFIEHITSTGSAATGYDARFSWPGFFAAGAALVHLAGLPDAEPLIRWAPVLYNVAAVPGLLVIGRIISGNRRAAWLGLLLYSGFNWFSQDYLSPQATVLLLYVAVVATLLATAVPVAVAERAVIRRLVEEARQLPVRPSWLTPRRSIGVELALLLICIAAVVTHQLTPVTLTGVLLAFTLTGSTRYRQLWLLTGLAFLAWFNFGAEDFWRGHLSYVFGDVGKLGNTLGASVGERLQGNPVHGRMQQIRLLWSAGSLALAGVGLWLRRDAPRPLMLATLSFSPFALLALQSYGGEVALRCFVYAQPAVAPLAALAVLWVLDRLRPQLVRAVALALVVAVAGMMLTTTRGANAGFERVTASQVRVARILLHAMPTGSKIGLLADAGPLGLSRLTDFEAVSLEPGVCGQDLVGCVRRNRPDYLYVTSTMDVLGQLQFGEPPGWTKGVIDELIRLRLYRRLAFAPDAIVLGRVTPR